MTTELYRTFDLLSERKFALLGKTELTALYLDCAGIKSTDVKKYEWAKAHFSQLHDFGLSLRRRVSSLANFFKR